MGEDASHLHFGKVSKSLHLGGPMAAELGRAAQCEGLLSLRQARRTKQTGPSEVGGRPEVVGRQ